MLLRTVTIYNYKSFAPEPQTITLGPGFNILFGQNNAGKTAALEAIALQVENKPHRSRHTVPAANGPVSLGESFVEFTFTVEAAELWMLLRQVGTFWLPLPRTKEAGLDSHEEAELRRFGDWVLSQTPLTFTYTFRNNNLYPSKFPSFGLYDALITSAGQVSSAACTADPSEQKLRSATSTATDRNGEFGSVLAQTLRSRLYLFKAERRIGPSALTASEDLASDASNLASVLNRLQANPVRFERFRKLVREVFPAIQAVSVRPKSGSELEVLLWFDEPDIEREDLAIPVGEAGTGTGQVLAILYVALTAQTPRTIIVDEPQNFLHPGAVANLIAICKRFGHHQYVFATHSPAVITSSSPSTVHQLRLDGRKTVVRAVDPRQTEMLRVLLQDIGASLGEVFGADRVLWTEGATEQMAFPLVLDAFAVPLLGTAIMGVKSTGDFEKRDAELVFDVYDRLSSSALLPPAVSFVFDSETRSEQKKADLIRRSHGKLRFLPLPMFENYLLVPDALAAVMNGTEGFRQPAITSGEVANWMTANAEQFRINGEPELAQFAHGANLLERLFLDLSESRVEYRKVEHGIAVTRWLLEQQRSHLESLAAFLQELLKQQAA